MSGRRSRLPDAGAEERGCVWGEIHLVARQAVLSVTRAIAFRTDEDAVTSGGAIIQAWVLRRPLVDSAGHHYSSMAADSADRFAVGTGGGRYMLENLNQTRATGADGSVRARPTGGTVVTLVGSVAHMETTGEVFSSSGVYATARLTIDLWVAENTTARLYAYRRSAQAIEQGEILPAFTSDLALTQRLAGDRPRVTLRLNDPLRSDRLEYRIPDATFTQESRRRTARPLLSLFASYAVRGAPREDAPVRREGPARIF